MRQCGNDGRRAMRSGAPAVTPGVSAQAGNAQCPMPNASRSVNCRITALPNYRIVRQLCIQITELFEYTIV